MKITNEELKQIILEELEAVLDERCEKGYKTHPTRKTKEMFGRTYRNCVKAEGALEEEFIAGGEASKYNGMSVDDVIDAIAKEHNRKSDQIRSEFDMGVEEEMEHAEEKMIAQEIALDHLVEDPEYYTKLLDANLEEAKKKKAGTESSKESSLRDWFGRKGAKGKKKGWVDCNAPDGSGGYKSCGRGDGEKRKKYPACRPTPSACKERGRGKSWGKKAKKKSKK